MARVTREERKKRRISALSRLQDGWGTGETIQYLMRDYGLTRRSANMDVVWANKELSKGFNNHDNKELPIIVQASSPTAVVARKSGDGKKLEVVRKK